MDHAMICRRGGFIIQRHNELRDLEAELLSIVCIDVQIEPALQEVNGEALKQGPNQAPDARLDVHACDFWEKQRSAFFDMSTKCRVLPRDLSPKQIYRMHENENKRIYTRRVTDIEQDIEHICIMPDIEHICIMPKNIYVFVRRALIYSLPNNYNLYRWEKIEAASCDLCSVRQTQRHMLSNCSVAVEEGRYTWRHDSILYTMLRYLS